MQENSNLFKFVRLHYRSGQHLDLCLTRQEILDLSVAVYNVENGIHHFTLSYDGASEVEDQLSHIIATAEVEHFEIDDDYRTLRELEIRGFKDMRIRPEPGFFKRLFYGIKWWFEDRKDVKK